MSEPMRLSRRTVLRGLGTAIALPWLERLRPARARRRPGSRPARRTHQSHGGRLRAQRRPHGGLDAGRWPATISCCPISSSRSTPFQNRLNVITGLAADKARPHGDGGGDHARSLAAFLTGCQAKKTHGADIRAGVSVDQLAAERIGEQTRFASLELGCERGPQTGDCDTGYSCAYSHNISWRTESSPMSKEVDPRLVFERLFADNTPEGRANRAKRALYQRSILDSVAENARDLRRQLGIQDGRKLDEYLDLRPRDRAADRPRGNARTAIFEPDVSPSRPAFRPIMPNTSG